MKKLALLLTTLALLLGSPVLAQQGQPELGIDRAGTCRNFSVRNATAGARVPIGCVHQTKNAFRLNSNWPERSIAIGTNALEAMSASNFGSNVAIGDNALAKIVLSNITVAIGDRAGAEILDSADPTNPGRAGVYVGHKAGEWGIGGRSNTFLGGFSGTGLQESPLIGNDNTCTGEASCLIISGDASFNSGYGFNSLFGLRYGYANAGYGVASGLSLKGEANDTTRSSNNAMFGTNSYRFGDGADNTLLGHLSGDGNTLITTTTAALTAGQTVIPVADTAIFKQNQVAYSGFIFRIGTKVTAASPQPSGWADPTIDIDDLDGDGVLTPHTPTPGTITVDTPTLVATAAGGVTIYSIPDQHTSTEVVCVGYNSCADISGTATQWAVVGAGAFKSALRAQRVTGIGRLIGNTCITCADVILIGDLADVPARNTTNYLNIGDAIYGKGVSNGPITDALIGIGVADPQYAVDAWGTVAATGIQARFLLQRNTGGLVAPGAANLTLRLQCGTNAGTMKLIALAGTSTTAATVLDNIGGGVTGC